MGTAVILKRVKPWKCVA